MPDTPTKLLPASIIKGRPRGESKRSSESSQTAKPPRLNSTQRIPASESTNPRPLLHTHYQSPYPAAQQSASYYNAHRHLQAVQQPSPFQEVQDQSQAFRQPVPYHGIKPDLSPGAPVHKNTRIQASSTEGFGPQLDFDFDQPGLLSETQDQRQSTSYQDTPPMYLQPGPGVQANMHKQLKGNTSPPGCDELGDLFNPPYYHGSTANASQHYNPMNLNATPWNNNGVGASSQLATQPMQQLTDFAIVSQQPQSLQHGSQQYWPAPTMDPFGMGASAADDNRGQEYQLHQCTCGDSCRCLACPVHPYNDATRTEALKAGRILHQDYLWANSGDWEQMDTAYSALPIMKDADYVEAQHLFPQSALADQNTTTESGPQSPSRSCCS